MAPFLSRIYLVRIHKQWRAKCNMFISITEDQLYTVNFANDQVIYPQAQDDAHYKLRKAIKNITNGDGQ